MVLSRGQVMVVNRSLARIATWVALLPGLIAGWQLVVMATRRRIAQAAGARIVGLALAAVTIVVVGSAARGALGRP